jgi:hypothetical protein
VVTSTLRNSTVYNGVHGNFSKHGWWENRSCIGRGPRLALMPLSLLDRAV